MQQVLGYSPCQKAAKLSTDLLCDVLMGYYKAHVNKKETYINHLTILVHEIDEHVMYTLHLFVHI